MSKKSSNKELKDRISEYLMETWDELTADIQELPPKERATARLKLFDYAIPKVQAVRESPPNATSTAAVLLAKEAKKKS